MDLKEFKLLPKEEQKLAYKNFKNKKEDFTSKMVHRCTEDVKINTILWNKQKAHLDRIYEGEEENLQRFLRYLTFKMDCIREQEEVGLKLDVDHCKEMIRVLEIEKSKKVRELAAAMPKVAQYKVKKYPRAIKVGDDIYTEGDMFFEMYRGQYKIESLELKTIKGCKEPNPSSGKQVKDWLYSLGWVPEHIKHVRNKSTNETKQIPQIASKEALRDGSGEICPSIHKLFNKEPKLELLEGFSVISHRIKIFEKFLEDQREGRIYPTIAGLTNTLRVRHKVVVNLPGFDKKYGKEVRASLIANDNTLLIGTDVSGLEDNMKRHYIYPYDRGYVEEMNVPGYDAHLNIGLLAGMLTQEEVDFYKSEDLKKKDKSYIPTKADKDKYDRIKATRNKTKIINFSATYKIGTSALARNSGMKQREAEKLLRVYWQRNKAILDIEKDLIVKTINGQQWLKNPLNNYWYSLRGDKDRFSTLNQGSGAYFFDIWLTFIRQAGIKVSLQMHDEALIISDLCKVDTYKKQVQEAMDKANERLKLNITMSCSIQTGSNYADCH